MALIGTGVGLGLSGGDNEVGPAKPRYGDSRSMSGHAVLTLLKSLLPEGRISDAWSTGAGGGRPTLMIPSGALVFDDGHGAARLTWGAARTDNPDVLASSTCPAKKKDGSCTETRLQDGSVVSVDRMTFGKANILLWTATVVTPKGDSFWLQETNSDQDGVPTSATRAEPPLTPRQLTALVGDPGWTRLFAAIRSAQPDHQLTAAQVTARARALLPAGSTPRPSPRSARKAAEP